MRVKEFGVTSDLVPLPLLIMQKRSGFACATSSCGRRWFGRDGLRFASMYGRSLWFDAYLWVVRGKEAMSVLVR